MSKEVSSKKSEKNVEKNTQKARRPDVGKLVERYVKRIYDVTGINPTEIVKTKDGKLNPKNIGIVKKLVKKKFPHLHKSGINKHLKVIFDEQYKTPSIPVFKREFEPFGSNISNDISNLIERFNTNVPFIKPNVIKSKRKYDSLGIPMPIEIKYDYNDMRYDKYSGIKNDAMRYVVDIVNEVFKGVNGEKHEMMRTNIINSIHNIKLKTAPNESREDIENKYKEDVLKIINNIDPVAYTFGINDDNHSIRNSLNDLKQKLIDRIKDDDFDIDDDPIENYREAVEYGVRRMMSDRLTDELLMELNAIDSYIDKDENREYDEDTIYNIYQKLSHFSDNIELKQINGIVVDKILRKRYHEVIPKIDEYLTKGYDKYRGKNKRMANNIDLIYGKYLIENDAIHNARNNTPDKEIELIRDINKSFDDKGGLKDKIVEEAKNTFNELGQTTRKTDRKNINHNMIANIIANKLDSMKDVKIDIIREVANDVLYGIKGKTDSKASKSITDKTVDVIANNAVNILFNVDEFSNSILYGPMKSMNKYVSIEPMNRFEMLPSEERANKLLKEAANKHQDVIENVMTDNKEEEDKNELNDSDIGELSKATIRNVVGKILDEIDNNELSELSKETIENIVDKVIKQFNEEHQEEEQPIEPEQQIENKHEEEEQEESFEEEQEESFEEEQEESFETSESSSIESVNEEEEELPEDENIHNEMTDSVGTPSNLQTLNSVNIPSGFANGGELSPISQPVGVDIPLEENPLDIPDQPAPPAVIGEQSTGTEIMKQDPNDIGRINASLEALNNQIASMRYAQSSTDTNNILGSIVSIFKELPNTGDDEIANKLSEAVGPDGKKLFESKEEAARFIAKMRALNGNRLSSIKGGGSSQKTGIQLNITNKVVSNNPPKPFIVDTHPIPYQY